MPVARVRERCGIPGTSARAAYLCRDKPTMKQVLREAGIPTAASTAVETTAEALDFARQVGYPLILKPRDAAGAAGTFRVDSDEQLAAACAASGVDAGTSVALEEFVEGHEGFLDTITIDGHVTPRVRLALLPERARGDAHAVDLPADHRHEPRAGGRSTRRSGRWAGG